MSRSPHDRLGPEGIARARAQRAAETALGEPARLVVWTPVLQTFITDAGRVAHVWTVAGEYRAEVPRMSVDPKLEPPPVLEPSTRG